MTQPPLEGPASGVPGVPGTPGDPAAPGVPESAGAPGGASVPPQWAWVQPAQQLVPVETEPLEYHRLYRGAPKFAWWKPILVAVIAASFYFAMALSFGLLTAPVLILVDPGYAQGVIDGSIPALDTQHPISILIGMVSIILMLPAVLLAMLAMGIRPIGRLWSVAGRMRWGLLLRTAGAAVVGVIVMNTAGILSEMVISGLAGERPTAETVGLGFGGPGFDVNAAIISGVLILFLVPFQAAAEEVVFRGLALQVLGSWMRSPWLAIGLSSVAFALMHIYDIWGMLAVGIMGLVAAWLTWKTGGLEAAIAIHVLNNLVAFGFMTAGSGGETGQVESTGGPGSVIGEVVGLAVFAWLVLRIFRKHGYGRERIDIVLRPAAVAAGVPAGPATPGAGVAQ